MSHAGDRLKQLSPEERRALLARMLGRDASAPRIAPLTFSQERIWFLEQLNPGSTTTIALAIRLLGQLDVEALRGSLRQIVQRHEVLRTIFSIVDEQPVQLILPAVSAHLPLDDLRSFAPEDRDREIDRLVAAHKQPADLLRGPLFQARLIWLAQEQHMLLLSFHHSIFDGWSTSVFARELATLYQDLARGRAPALPDLPIQYADFARWQREQLQGAALERQIGYWRQQLRDLPAVVGFPPDRPYQPDQTPRSGREQVALPYPLSERLKALSQREGATLFMTLLAAISVLLYRYSGQADVTVGTYIANRNRSELEHLIGFFTNTLVLRTQLHDNPTFRELLRHVGATTLDAYANQDVPFDRLLQDLRPKREVGRAPLFRVMLILQNMPDVSIDLPGLTIQLPPASQGVDLEGTDADLTLFFSDTGMGLAGSIEYDANLFEAATVGHVWQRFHTLLAGIVANPDTPIRALPLLTAEERELLIAGLNQTHVEYPRDKLVQELFAAQVERSPDAVAVSYDGDTVTYGELNGRANQLAHYLRRLGVGPDVLVGVLLDRSIDMVVALLGVLKAGGAYLPLDPAYPAQRLQAMSRDAGVRIVLTQERVLATTVDLAPAIRAIALDGTARPAIARESRDNPELVALPQHLAYVIYTSGSTGRPKGVMVSQQALVQFATASVEHFAIGQGDRILQFASIGFDAAAEEIYPCLLGGAALVLRTSTMLDSSEHFLRACAAESISVLDLPTAYWHVLCAEIEQYALGLPPTLRLVILGGEALLVSRLRTWLAHAPGQVRLVNTYGPTETTVVATMHDLDTDRLVDKAISAPIGRPIANVSAYVLDARMQPVPVGVPGELYIGGDGLARGYLNHPDFTAAAFVPNPFAGTAPVGSTAVQYPTTVGPRGSRLYRTGDLVRLLPNGAIDFLGRVDQQVKIRGFRVEPGEVEAVLSQHPEVRAAAVAALKLGDTNGLVAYVVPREVSQEHLRDFLRERLPDYMIPAAYVLLDSLPMTPSGKIDRRRLPAPAAEQTRAGAYVPPETPIERKLAEIWAKILEIEQVSVDDDFFELGGHSLLATRLIHRINKSFNVELSLRDLFEQPTVADLALLIEEILIEKL